MTDRRLPVGAEAIGEGVHFRVWAPKRRQVEAVFEGSGRTVALAPEGNGYFSILAAEAGAGDLYRYRLDGKDAFPDPASRFQPDGPFGPSEVVDPGSFAWSDGDWPGPCLKGAVLYEMHIGAFTPEGTWEAAARQLPALAELGATILEVMPVADFPGRFGWGYDGVDFFAPTRLYGRPDDFRRFVDAAHTSGLGVILDVVYNHAGPAGMFLKEFSEHYFTARYKNEWGEPINFDGDHSGPVREFFLANARYWVEEFHLDGLRLDATQQIFDSSRRHILLELTETVRASAGSRRTIVVAENEPQDSCLVRAPEHGGYGLDAIWNDDFHHSAMVALTGRREAYYHDYRGTPQEFVSAAKFGFLYQGQLYAWQRQRRGMPALDVPGCRFVTFIQNHDQVANSLQGERCHAQGPPARCRALTALLLLMPGTPMLFMGQEFCASTPFTYFADHAPGLLELVRQGRLEFLSQFPRLALPEVQADMPSPGDQAAFSRCKLDFSEREKNREMLDLHKDLLRLRREDPVIAAQRSDLLQGAVIGPNAFLLRFSGRADAPHRPRDTRLLLVNLGGDLSLDVAPEPLLAPPWDAEWAPAWSSEDIRYGGGGTPPVYDPENLLNWRLPADSAVLLRPVRRADAKEA